MMKLFLAISMFFLFLINIGCNATEPVIEDNTPAGSRDYEWTVDTLKTTEAIDISRMWGDSPNNVWAIGTSSWTATAIWHFDGTKWNCDSIPRNINPWAVFGCSANEVWLGNSNSTIWKFDGTSWNLFQTMSLAGYNHIIYQNIYGPSSNDIWAVGYASQKDTYIGIITHFDGKEWELIKIPNKKVNFSDVRVDKATGTLVLEGTTDSDGGYLCTWDGNELKTIYSGVTPAVSNINDQVIVVIEQKIYKYKNGRLELWMDKTGSSFVGKIWGGRSEKDFFWNSYGGIVHYNGTDFEVIYNTNLDADMGISAGVILDNDVFFIAKSGVNEIKNVMIHGKLKTEGTE